MYEFCILFILCIYVLFLSLVFSCVHLFFCVVVSLLLFLDIHSMAHLPAPLLRIFHGFLCKLTQFRSAGSTKLTGVVAHICAYKLAVLIQFKNREIGHKKLTFVTLRIFFNYLQASALIIWSLDFRLAYTPWLCKDNSRLI
jgi:hypothetical protein